MKNLKTLLQESIVQESFDKSKIESWCKEVGIKKYTINNKGEIDVNTEVNLEYINTKELPYKFGKVNGNFIMCNADELTSLKNCPNHVTGYVDVSYNKRLKSLDGFPKRVDGDIYVNDCFGDFTQEDVLKVCKIFKNGKIYTEF